MESSKPESNESSAVPDDISPLSTQDRISSVDTLRGFALLGILVINIHTFALPGAADENPYVYGGYGFLDLAFWFVCILLFEGKMRTIFSMLFGAGAYILISRAEKKGSGLRIADIYYRRTIWLIIFGMLHAYFIWWGDVLFFYGVVGLLLFPLRNWSAKALIGVGLCTLAVGVPKAVHQYHTTLHAKALTAAAKETAERGEALTEEQTAAQRTWTNKMQEARPTSEQIENQLAENRSGYWAQFPIRARVVRNIESTLFYDFVFTDVAGMMLIGMALMKLGIFSAERSLAVYKWMMICGYGIGLPILLIAGVLRIYYKFDMLHGVLLLRSTYDLTRLAVASGHIGLLMYLCKQGTAGGITSRLAAVGRMALTNYLMQSVICAIFFYGVGFGMHGRLARYQLVFVIVAIWAFQLLVSPIWLRYFRFGPMEWVWRSLTYWKKQPMLVGSQGSSNANPH